MPKLTVRNVPETLLARLRTAAARQKRNQQARGQLAAWRALAGRWTSDLSFEAEVAEIYAARTATRDAPH